MEPHLANADVGIKIKQEAPPVLVNNIIANELKPNRIGTSSRLPSFKGPRDLTLSALASTSCRPIPQFTRTKKTFQPNIPVRREKGDRIVESKSEKSLKRNSTNAKLDHGRGRARFKEKEFVQTKGTLFGEGIAATHSKRATTSIYRTRGDGKTGSIKGEMQRPVLNPDATNVNKDLEEQRLKEILRDDFIDDVEEVIPEDSMPIQLPMMGLGESQLKEEVSEGLKKDSIDDRPQDNYNFGVQVKKEPGTEGNRKTKEKINGIVHHPTPPSGSLGQGDFVEGSVAHLLTKSISDSMFFQLPSCLPGHPPEVKSEPQPHPSSSHSSTSGSNEQGVGSSPEAAKTPLCSLSTLPEGRIGSIKVYESGRVELCLGNHNLEINRGTQVGFLQDVVRVEADAEAKTGSMVVLGHIKDRLVCTPDFDSLTRNLKLS